MCLVPPTIAQVQLCISSSTVLISPSLPTFPSFHITNIFVMWDFFDVGFLWDAKASYILKPRAEPDIPGELQLLDGLDLSFFSESVGLSNVCSCNAA